MNRDEVLARSRRNKSEYDERELQVYLRACQLSRIPVIVVCTIYALFDLIRNKSLAGGCVFHLVIFGMMATENWIVVCRVKKRSNLLLAVFSSALVLFYLGYFILGELQ